MWPDRISNPGPLALESDVLQIALRGPAIHLISSYRTMQKTNTKSCFVCNHHDKFTYLTQIHRKSVNVFCEFQLESDVVSLSKPEIDCFRQAEL